jgi:hypothetical protein
MSALFRYRLPGLLACAILSLPNIAIAAKIPLDEEGFTTALAEAFRKVMPGFKVTIRGPLALTIVGPDSDSHQSALDTVYGFCQRNPENCDEAVKGHVAEMSDTFARKKTLDRSLLRAVVRPVGYVDAIRKVFAGKEEPPVAPFMGDLWIICMYDMPQAISTLGPGDLAKLGLSREEALEIAMKNDAALFAPVEQVGHSIPEEHIGLVATNPYESSRLLLPESWSTLAAKYGGQLLVAAPGTGVMIYADGRQPNALQIMRDHAAMVAMRVTRQLSPTIFRWTPVGWVVAG